MLTSLRAAVEGPSNVASEIFRNRQRSFACSEEIEGQSRTTLCCYCSRCCLLFVVAAVSGAALHWGIVFVVMWTVEICCRPAAGFAGVDSVVGTKLVGFPSHLVHLVEPEGRPCHQRGSFRYVKLLQIEVIRNASQVVKGFLTIFEFGNVREEELNPNGYLGIGNIGSLTFDLVEMS